VIGVPIVNTTAFSSHMRYSFIDHKDLDFSFTDNPLGTFTERLAGLLLRELTSTLSDEDFMFDLHGSPGGTLTQPWVAYYAGGTSPSRRAAEATGITVVCISATPEYKENISEGTTLADEYMPTAFAKQMLKRVKLGRLVIESGSTVVLEPEVMVQYNGVMNVMKHLGMLEGSPTQPTEKRIYINDTRRVMARNRGFWPPMVPPGSMVSKGEMLAVVADE